MLPSPGALLRKWRVVALIVLIVVIIGVVRTTRRTKPPFGVYTRFLNITKSSHGFYQCPAPPYHPPVESLPAGFPTELGRCTVRFKGYTPSAEETFWREQAERFKDADAATLCRAFLEPGRAIRSESWLADRAALTKSRAVNLEFLAPGLLSEMVYEATCPEGSHTWSEWIEPLTMTGRHPFALTKTCCEFAGTSAVCDAAPPAEDLMSIDHLLMQSKGSAFWPLHRAAGGSGKAFLFDVGTSFFDTSMLILACTYRNLRGIDFDAMYGWEYTLLDSDEYWSRVAPEFKSRVHFTNLPASSAPGAATNPLTVLKSVARREDFVAIKLDIDHTKTELELLAQILDDPETLALVDELFYEYHFDFPPMYEFWFPQRTERKVDGAFELFARARALGVRMHFWP